MATFVDLKKNTYWPYEDQTIYKLTFTICRDIDVDDVSDGTVVVISTQRYP